MINTVHKKSISTKDMILVALFAALMSVGSFLKILFPVIPLSLQPFFCALAGLLLGSKLGALSQLVYILLGLAGLPVFTQGGGLMYIFKPSFGFIIGFAAGSYCIGKIAGFFKRTGFVPALIASMAGLAAIYAVGLPYMYLIMKYYLKMPDISFNYIIAIGFLPFILKDLATYALAAVIASAALPALKKAGLLAA